MATTSEQVDYLAAHIYNRAEVLSRPSPVPRSPGVYGWWFQTLPADLDTTRCAQRDGLTLLYTGISPKEPPKNGRPPSRQTLRSRIRTHYTGNAAGSTLRLTLGCLLADRLDIELRRYGSGKRFHFGAGERMLSRWMNDNAFVSWIEHPQPWVAEIEFITRLDLPLNLSGNKNHAFCIHLTGVRAAAFQRARNLVVLPNPGIGGSKI